MKKIAVICASWNEDIVASGLKSFEAEMTRKGFPEENIDVFYVPGSLEIPLTGKMLLEKGYDLAIGIGFVVNGGIYRHEFVAQAVISGIVDVQLQTGKPFLSVVLTPITFNEHVPENVKYFIDHMVIKGKEAAHACAAMLEFDKNQKKAA